MAKTARAKKRGNKVAMESARFLTIDLDVRSRSVLTPLLAAWPEAYLPVNDSRWLIRNAFGSKSAEAAAKSLLEEILKLKGKALASWKRAHRRTLDIGVQAGGAARAFEEVRLSADTERIAKVGGQIQLTVYPAEPKNP